MVRQLICNQLIGGSTPPPGSMFKEIYQYAKKKQCSDCLILSATMGCGGTTEIFCHRKLGHKGRHCGIATRIVVSDNETDDSNIDTRIYWDGTEKSPRGNH